ncbi:MAG: glucose-6-phosphate dehydrogenase [Mangrovicoccus sp.]|nr:glucose-6-phosphate dehydrogenase [Mangrovicoccus sp.]
MASRIIPVGPFDLVVFGGTGDLARRKILPGLYRRYLAGQMPKEAQLIGAARSKLDADGYRAFVREALEEFIPEAQRPVETVQGFLAHLQYVSINALGPEGWQELSQLLRGDVVRAFYFSVTPSLFSALAAKVHQHGLAGPDCRIVIEKPFGHNLASAKALNAELATYFDETQVYRIDHYLGKETVQNLMAVRFGNILFEPLWNAQYIDHVQITVAETVGVGGRGSYYDQSGAMRDMVQNHLMQLLCLTAMEPPAQFDPDAVRDEKLKVIRALQPVAQADIVRGQYMAAGGMPGYLEDVGDPASSTESFVAMRASIANWRWKGTPFYLRTGKRMRARMSEIVVRFKQTRHSIFDEEARGKPNELAIRLQPNEGIDLRVTIKEPGPGGMRLIDVPLDMTFAEALGPDAEAVPDAYERLIMDVIRGNQTLFMRGDEVEAAWAWTDPIISAWKGDRRLLPMPYEAGGPGPEEALALMHRDDRRWKDIRV